MSIPRIYNVWEVATDGEPEHHIIHSQALPPAIPKGAVLITQVHGDDRTSAAEAFANWQAQQNLAQADVNRRMWEQEEVEALNTYLDGLPEDQHTTGLYDSLLEGLQAELDYVESENLLLEDHNETLMDQIAESDQIIDKLRETIEEQQNTIELLKHRVAVNEEAAQKFEALATHLEQMVNQLTDGDIASA